MNAQEFAYWLNGFIELNDNDIPPTVAQWKSIREHLNLVFKKVTTTVDNKITVTPTTTGITGISPIDFDEIVRKAFPREQKEQDVPATPYEYPKYPDPFKFPQSYPDFLFPGYDPSRTVITC